MDDQFQKLLDKLSEILEIIINIINYDNNIDNINDENKNKLKYIFRKYEEIFYLILNGDIENVYNLTFYMKQWRTLNINNYLFSIDEGKKLIQEISHFQLLFMMYMREI